MSADAIARGLAAQTRLAARRRAALQRLADRAVAAGAANPIDLPVLASPPTLSEGTAQALTRAYRVDTTPGAWRMSGGVALPGGYSTDGAAFWRFGSARTPVADNIANAASNPQATTPFYRSNCWRAAFWCDEPKLEIVAMGNAAGAYRLLVGGQYVSKTATGYGGNNRRVLTVTFGDGGAGYRQPRLFEFESSGASGLFGVNVSPLGSVHAPAGIERVDAAFIGDSYTAGAGATSPSASYSLNAWPLVASRLLGWAAPQQQAIGGTGYLATNSGGQMTFRQRIADLDQRGYDVVVCAGGYNDAVTSQAPAAIAAEALAQWQAIRARQPAALIVVTGAWSPAGASAAQRAQVQAAEDALATAFAGWGDPFALYLPVARAETPWLTGTGYAGATTGDGNSDVYVGSDKVHPNDAGHDWLARRFAGGVRGGVAAMVRALG